MQKPTTLPDHGLAQGSHALARRALSGVTWALGQNMGARIISVLSQLVLAKLLVPRDFGDIGLAYSVTALVATITGFGADDFVMSRGPQLHRWEAAAFWASLGIASVVAVVVFAAAPIAAVVYHNDRLTALIWVLALSIPLTALTTVPSVKLRTALKFRQLAGIGFAEVVLTQFGSIGLAASGLGAMSFAIPAVAVAGLKAAALMSLSRIEVRRRIRPRQVILLGISSSMVLVQKLFTAVRNNADYMVLGVTASATVVGFYYFAFRLAALPVYTLTASLTTVVTPMLRRLRNDPRRQLGASILASRLIAFLAIPLCFLQAVVAKPLLHLFFGTKWDGSGDLLEVLSIGLSWDVVPCVAGAALNANGKFKSQLWWAALSLPLFLIMISTGSALLSAKGVAFGVLAFFGLTAPAFSYYALRPLGAKPLAIVRIYLVPTAAAALAGGLALAVSGFKMVPSDPIVQLAVRSVVFSVACLAVISVCQPDIVSDVRTLLSRLKPDRGPVPEDVS